MKNRKVIYNSPNPPCGTEKITFHSKDRQTTHTRYIKRTTLEQHGYLLDRERGLLVKEKL